MALQLTTPLDPGVPGELVEEELRAILASPPFHTSRRCSDFLQFIVRRTLEGRSAELKERTIASEVFGRDSFYEPKLDALVRVRANDLRKRLAQYYQSAGPAARVRLDLPLGCYVPTLELIPQITPAVPSRVPEPAAPSRQMFAFLATACLLLFAAFTVWQLTHRRSPSDLEDFWGLLLASPKPVVVCVMPSASYVFSDPARLTDRFVRPDRRRYEVALDSSFDFGPRLVYEVDGTLAIGDSLAVAAVSHGLGELHKPVVIKGGEEVTFADMKGGPAVLIGAFNNRWAMEINAGLPIRYEPLLGISDTTGGRSYQVRQEQGKVVEDFGLISRLIAAKTGGPLVTVGGIKHYATQIAADLVTSPDYLRNLVKKLPSGWQNRNLQVVVKTVLVQERPGPPEVVAVHVW